MLQTYKITFRPKQETEIDELTIIAKSEEEAEIKLLKKFPNDEIVIEEVSKL